MNRRPESGLIEQVRGAVRHVDDANYQLRLRGCGLLDGDVEDEQKAAFHFVLVQRAQSRLFHTKLASCEGFTRRLGRFFPLRFLEKRHFEMTRLSFQT